MRVNATAASLLLAGMLAGSPAPLAGQDYPSRTVRIINALGAGGLSDLFLRSLAQELQKRWGQPVIVEDRAGASGNIGARACADSAPDGYTVCVLSSAVLVYNPYLFKAVPFDPETGFTPITNLYLSPQLLAVNASLGVKNLDGLAALSKAKPGTLSYFAPGLSHAAFIEHFKQDTGADLVRVPFKGGADATNAILGGSTPVGFFGLGNFTPLLESGAVNGLAIDGAVRSALVPGVPTLREIGYRGDMTVTFFALMAPAGLPAPIAAKWRDDIGRVVQTGDFAARNLTQRGLEPALGTSEELARRLSEDRAAAKRIVAAAGLQPE